MNRAEKLKVLQNTLRGQTGALSEMHRQQRAKAMPYLEAHAIIDVSQCPPELLSLTVCIGESLIEDKRDYRLLSDWINQLADVAPKSGYRHDVAYDTIDANDDQYDAVKVTFVVVRSRDFSSWYLPSLTIGDLRRYYNQSEASCMNSVLVLCFEDDMSRYEYLTNRKKSV